VDAGRNDLAERLLDLYEEATARVFQLRAELDDAEKATAGLHQALVAMGVVGVAETKELSGKRLRTELDSLLREIDPNHEGVHYQELTQRLLDRGHAISGQNKANNVRAHVSHSPMFRQLGRGLMTWVDAGREDAETAGEDVETA
jgi:hypothetical protein